LELVADTCFFIDLQRKKLTAIKWLENWEDVRLVVTPVTVGELLVGQPDENVVQRLMGDGRRLVIGEAVGREYGLLARYLRERGKLIGSNDLWIAALCLVHRLPILTRNVGEFGRVPDLQIVEY
jgi:predicted nucleic acid-binding protein